MSHTLIKTLIKILGSAAVAVAVLFTGVISAGFAEVIHIPVGQQAPENRNLPRPQRGQAHDEVLRRFGEPISMSAPVGEPPISKWLYPDFTVYFEDQTVIHSVLTHRPKYPIPASPSVSDESAGE